MGFFPAAVGRRKKTLHVSAAPRCDLCRYCETAHTPRQEPVGRGRVMLLGEFPDSTSDLSGRPFSRAVANATFAPALSKAGLSMADVVYVNALACRPDTKRGESKLTEAVNHCRPAVLAAVEKHKPTVIIPMGDLAVRSILAQHYDGDVPLVADRWAGYHIPIAALKAWVCPTNNPLYAAARREGVTPDGKKSEAPARHFDAWFKAALTKVDDPLPVVNPLAGVKLVWDDDTVIDWLAAVNETEKVIAFDFETTGLKPESPEQEIVCCSVCDGDETIAFMWSPKTAAALRTVLRNPAVGKIASNLKFETRWCISKLKTRVANWRWDTMQAAHIMDCRWDDQASIKFQAFALCGVRPWDGHVKPFLEASGSANAINRVKQLDRRDLLTYCAIDSKMEYEVARIQAAALGVVLETWK